MEGLRAWWGRLSGSGRALLSLGGLVVVGIFGVVTWISGNTRATESELAGLAEDNETLASDLQAAQSDLQAAQERLSAIEELVGDLKATIKEQEGTLAFVERAEDRAKAELEDVRRSLTEALDAKQAAETLVAELTLAYSPDINAARAAVAGGVAAFACEWGTARATEGSDLNAVTGQAALQAFAASDQFQALGEAPEIATYLNVATRLGQDPYGVPVDEVQRIAIECWQSEDAKLNAALYAHQAIFREAILDAACTNGTQDVFGRSLIDHEDTAVYRNWELTIGGHKPASSPTRPLVGLTEQLQVTRGPPLG